MDVTPSSVARREEGGMPCSDGGPSIFAGHGAGCRCRECVRDLNHDKRQRAIRKKLTPLYLKKVGDLLSRPAAAVFSVEPGRAAEVVWDEESGGAALVGFRRWLDSCSPFPEGLVVVRSEVKPGVGVVVIWHRHGR